METEIKRLNRLVTNLEQRLEIACEALVKIENLNHWETADALQIASYAMDKITKLQNESR